MAANATMEFDAVPVAEFDAIPVAEFDAVPVAEFDAIPVAVPVAEFDAVPVQDAEPSPETQQEAVRGSAAALQALDVMRAPLHLDWSDVAEQSNYERFYNAESLRAQALAAEENGSGTGPDSESFKLRRAAERISRHTGANSDGSRLWIHGSGLDCPDRSDGERGGS
jgi:hypothetical protein